MGTKTLVARWGNSLAVRLPKSIAHEARVEEGDTVDLSVDDGTIVVRPGRPSYSLDELVDRITPDNRHKETDWTSAVGHEAW